SESSFIKLVASGRGTIAKILQEKVGGREAPIVQQELTAAAESSKWRLAVDLTGVTLLSSIGLGALVTLHKRAREENGVFVVCGVGKDLMGILKLTHLDRILKIVSDEEAAAKALA